MKKKKLSNLRLNKVKIANLNTMRTIAGGSAQACETAESNLICPVDTGAGGGGGGGTGIGCESVIDCHFSQQCEPTQQSCHGQC